VAAVLPPPPPLPVGGVIVVLQLVPQQVVLQFVPQHAGASPQPVEVVLQVDATVLQAVFAPPVAEAVLQPADVVPPVIVAEQLAAAETVDRASEPRIKANSLCIFSSRPVRCLRKLAGLDLRASRLRASVQLDSHEPPNQLADHP
jgi:hypothetical protein